MQKAPPLIWGWRAWLGGFVFWTVVGLLLFGYQYLDVVVRDGSEPFYERLIEELTGAYVTGCLTIGIITLARTIQGHKLTWVRAVPIHALAAPIYSTIHTTLLWGSRLLVWNMLGLGTYDYGRMPVRYFMEMGRDFLDYLILASLIHLILHYRASQQRALQVAQLERELTQARLQALEGQLRPHFLFNALNTVSSVMYRDVAAADRVLAQLGELLRSSLKSDDSHEVTLREEIATLELYLEIMRARFGDHLTVNVSVDPTAEDALVPHLLLQPLVENALEHGKPDGDTEAHVKITAARRDESVVLSVEDNGKGIPKGDVEFGVGLSNTAARLEHLYPSKHTMSIRNGDRGLTVDIALPFKQ